MVLHGCDVMLNGVAPTKEQVLEVVKQFWPHLVVEDDGVDYLVYKHDEAQAIWDTVGWTEKADDQMFCVCPAEKGLWLIIDDKKKLMPVVEAIAGITGCVVSSGEGA